MIPTQEEVQMIIEASQQNSEKELGTAEHLLVTMSSIPELIPRLKLWSFRLDYDQREKVSYPSGGRVHSSNFLNHALELSASKLAAILPKVESVLKYTEMTLRIA